MAYPREILNRLKWTQGESLDEATVWYIHRGAPGNSKKIRGSSIQALDKYYFETDESAIPYHRVLRIDYRGRTLFQKDDRAKQLR